MHDHLLRAAGAKPSFHNDDKECQPQPPALPEGSTQRQIHPKKLNLVGANKPLPYNRCSVKVCVNTMTKKWHLGLLTGCFVWFSVSAIEAEDALIQNIEALISEDPVTALQQARELWVDREISASELKAGILLTNALIANQLFPEADVIINQFQVLPDLSDTQRLLILAQKITWMRKSKATDDIAPLINQGDDLLPELTAQESDPEVANAIHEFNEAIAYKRYFEGAFAAAEPRFFQALKYLATDQHSTRSELYNSLGVVKAQQADLAGAAEYMLKSIEELETHELPVAPSRYQNLGSLNFMLKEWDKTIEYSEKALSMQPEDAKVRASLLSNIAAAYVEKGQLAQATEYLQNSIQISEQAGNSASSAHNNLGYIYNQLGKYEQALYHLEQSKADFIKHQQGAELNVVYKSMADVYANMGDYDRAASLYQQAYDLHQTHDFKMKRVELYPKWIDVLVQGNNYQRAYELMVEFKDLQDEITDVATTEKVNELLTSFEVEKKEQALANSELLREEQQKNIELLKTKAAFDEKIRLLLSLLLVGLVVILLLTYRSWRFRGRVNQLLLNKNQRIEKQHQQLQNLNDQLKEQTEIDTLTGLKNRRYLTQMIATESAKKRSAQKHWCLVILDLDNFKHINDTYGHQRGDEVLIQFAKCLNQNKADNDVVARWGGEEFLWLTEIDSVNQGAQRCDALQRALSEARFFRDDEIKVTCSMGFSSFPLVELSFADWEAALKLADYALYQAKSAGKNTWYGFKVMDHHLNYSDINNVEDLLKGNRLSLLSKDRGQ